MRSASSCPTPLFIFSPHNPFRPSCSVCVCVCCVHPHAYFRCVNHMCSEEEGEGKKGSACLFQSSSPSACFSRPFCSPFLHTYIHTYTHSVILLQTSFLSLHTQALSSQALSLKPHSVPERVRANTEKGKGQQQQQKLAKKERKVKDERERSGRHLPLSLSVSPHVCLCVCACASESHPHTHTHTHTHSLSPFPFSLSSLSLSPGTAFIDAALSP